VSYRAHDPIAIVGAACRLPGAANIGAFWNVLAHGRDTVAALPVGRRAAHPGDTVPDGGFLERIDAFDAPFFDLSPHEAMRMDPHHRLLLETV
jgi:acyl transferase domain-containing protein